MARRHWVLYIRKGTRFSPFMTEATRRVVGGRDRNVPYIVGPRQGLRTGEERTWRMRIPGEGLKGLPRKEDPGDHSERSGEWRIGIIDAERRSVSASNTWKRIYPDHAFRSWVCASSGSACTSGSPRTFACSQPWEFLHGSPWLDPIQPLHLTTPRKKWITFWQHPRIIAGLRDISPSWKDYLKIAGESLTKLN